MIFSQKQTWTRKRPSCYLIHFNTYLLWRIESINQQGWMFSLSLIMKLFINDWPCELIWHVHSLMIWILILVFYFNIFHFCFKIFFGHWFNFKYWLNLTIEQTNNEKQMVLFSLNHNKELSDFQWIEQNCIKWVSVPPHLENKSCRDE